jgi:hypothetical protein
MISIMTRLQDVEAEKPASFPVNKEIRTHPMGNWEISVPDPDS